MASCSSTSEYVADSVEFTEPVSSEDRPETITAPSHSVEESVATASSSCTKYYVGHGGVLKHPLSALEPLSNDPSCDAGSLKDEVKRPDRRPDTRLDELEESVKEMKVQHSKDIEEIKEKLQTKSRQLKEKEFEICQLKQELERRDREHQSELERRDNDVLKMKEDLETKKQKIEELELERMELREEIETLKKDVTEIKTGMNVLNQNNGLQSTVDQLQRGTEEVFPSGNHDCVTKKELKEVLHEYKEELGSMFTKVMVDHAMAAAQAKVVISTGTDKSCDHKSKVHSIVSKCGSVSETLSSTDHRSLPSNKHDSISDANNEER